MMKSTALTGIALGLLMAGSSAFAASGGFVGNTIHVITPGAGEVFYAMAEDGTLTGTDGTSGKWAYDGTSLCFQVETQEDFCGAFDGSKQVGDSWEDAAWDGNGTAQIHLMQGLNLPAQ